MFFFREDDLYGFDVGGFIGFFLILEKFFLFIVFLNVLLNFDVVFCFGFSNLFRGLLFVLNRDFFLEFKFL